MSSVVLASLSDARSKARDSKRVGELRAVEKAIALYALDHNGNVPMSQYTMLSQIPTINNHIACNDTTLIANNNNLYDTLIPKYLSTRPLPDPQAAQGYCYVYITGPEILVAGASYNQDGKLTSSGPISAVITNYSKSSVFAIFLENIKTNTGYQAFVGISHGIFNPEIENFLNINYTSGKNNDVNAVANMRSGFIPDNFGY